MEENKELNEFDQLVSSLKSSLTQKQPITDSFHSLREHPLFKTKQHYAALTLASGTGVRDLHELFFKVVNSREESEIFGCIDMFCCFCLYPSIIKLMIRLLTVDTMKMYVSFMYIYLFKFVVNTPRAIMWISTFLQSLYNIGADIMLTSNSSIAAKQLLELDFLTNMSFILLTTTDQDIGLAKHEFEQRTACIAIFSRAANFLAFIATHPDDSFNELQQHFFQGPGIHNLLLFQIWYVQHILFKLFLVNSCTQKQQQLLRRSEIQNNLQTPYPIPRSFLLSTFLNQKFDTLLTPVENRYKEYFLCILGNPVILLDLNNSKATKYLSTYLKETPNAEEVLVRYVEANTFMSLKWSSTCYWLKSCSSSHGYHGFYKLCESWRRYLKLSLHPGAQYIYKSFNDYDVFWTKFNKLTDPRLEFTNPTVQCDSIRYEMAASLQEQGEVDLCCYLYCTNLVPTLTQTIEENRRLQVLESVQKKNHVFQPIKPFPTICLALCSSCKLFRYCSKECQKNAWKTHKLNCKLTKEQK